MKLELFEYQALLQYCEAIKDFELGQTYWRKMKEENIVPNATTYMTFILLATKYFFFFPSFFSFLK